MNELKHYGIKGMVWKNRKTKTAPPIENPLKNNNIDYRHPNVKTKGKPSFKRFEAKYFSNGAEKFVESSKKIVKGAAKYIDSVSKLSAKFWDKFIK